MPTDLAEISVVAGALAPDLRAALQQARAAGFDGVLLDLEMRSLRLTELSSSGRRELRSLLSGHQLKLTAVRAHLGPRGFGEGADIDRALSTANQALRAAAELGASVVCMDVGALPPARRIVPERPKLTPEQAGLILIPPAVGAPSVADELTDSPQPSWASQVIAALSEVGKLADRYSVPVAFGNALASFAAMNEGLATVSCPWFGIDLDPVAVLRDPWPLEQVLSVFTPVIHHVRARDAIRGDDRRTTPAVIGAGDVSWDKLISLLRAGDRPLRLTIDPGDLPDPRASAITGLNRLRPRTSLP